MTRKRSLIARIRSAEYRQARLRCDVRAVQTARVGRQVYNRPLGRALARLFRR